jgi:hypothetical protein
LLKEALDSIQSVRALPRHAAQFYRPIDGVLLGVPELNVLRPRAYVFAYYTSWSDPSSVDTAFKDLLPAINDHYRPNGVCILDQTFISRYAGKVETKVHKGSPLMHFFNHLILALSRRPTYFVDLGKYITGDYGD